MTKNIILLVAVALLANTQAAHATIVVSGNDSPARQVQDGLSGADLDLYEITLVNTAPGERITAVSLTFEGMLNNLQVANFLGTVAPTASIDALTGFPQNLVDSDSHSLIPTDGFVIPPGSGDLSEDILASAGANNPTSGTVDQLRLINLALAAERQTAEVLIAQIVVPRGTHATASGIVAASNDGGNPFTVDFAIVPEPTSLMLAGLGLVGFVARRRRS